MQHTYIVIFCLLLVLLVANRSCEAVGDQLLRNVVLRLAVLDSGERPSDTSLVSTRNFTLVVDGHMHALADQTVAHILLRLSSPWLVRLVRAVADTHKKVTRNEFCM